MSDLTEIQARVLTILGDTAQAQFSNADIVRWANDAQIDIAKKTEVLWATVGNPVSAGLALYNVSTTDFLYVRRVIVNNNILRRTTTIELDKMYPDRLLNVPTGQPTFWYISSFNTVGFFPTPDVNGTYLFEYVRRPSTLVQGSAESLSIPGHMLEDVVRYCLIRAKEEDEDWKAAEYLKNDYKERVVESTYEAQVQHADSYPAIREAAGESW